jgi:transglutaminase-like putative cysteine protease
VSSIAGFLGVACEALMNVLYDLLQTVLRSVIVPAFLFLPATALFAAKDSVPDWVRTAAAQKLPSYPADTNAVVLLNEVTYTVAPDGKAVEHVRKVTKILRPQGRDEGLVYVPFGTDQKILSMHVWSISPEGHEFAVNDKEIVEFGEPGGGILYEDIRFKAAKPPGRDPGGIVALEYEQSVLPYIAEKTWFFQGDIPRLSQTFTLELPAGFTYSTVWAHHPTIKESDLENRRWRWEMKETPAIDLERVLHRPSFLALSGRMTVRYAPAGKSADAADGWKNIGEWYDALSHDRLASTPEIAAKANELAAGKADFYDKTEAIAEFVQKQIRYFAIEMGIGGYQPHFAADIYRNRYGDCKDKATLLSSMLSTVGVHAALLMVDDRRGVIDPQAPSIVGDHMVAAIEIPKGYESKKLRSVVTAKTGRRYLVFDPTWEKTPFGQFEHELQGSYGVLMEGAESQVIALPVLSPELNTIHRTASMRLDAEGTLKGSIVERRFGDVSTRRRTLYTHGDAKEQSEYIDHALEQDFPTFKVSEMKVENAEALNKDLTNTYTLDVDRYGRSMGQLLMVRPRILGSEAPAVNHERRTVPIDLRETMQAKDEYDIELPSGYAVDELPEAVKLDLGFASYESSSQVKGNILHYSRTYTVREVTLPPEKYADLQKLSSVIATDEQSRAVLKKQ